MALPPGWGRVTTGVGSEASQRRFVDDALRVRSGTDRVLAERDLAPRVARLVAAAEENGALDLYHYRRQFGDVLVTAQFTVAVLYLGIAPTDDELLAVARGQGADEAEFAVIGAGDHAVRATSRSYWTPPQLRDEVASFTGDDPATADEVVREAEQSALTLRVTRASYLVRIPGNPSALLLIASDVVEGPLEDALILHFDAIVSTLEWV